MRYGKTISLVIPALDEEKNLPLVLDRLPSYIDEIIVVDGHSSDATVRIAESRGCRVFYDTRGKGSALTKGIRESSGDIIITIDADMSHEPLELGQYVTTLAEGNDLCLGSRFMRGGGSDDISLVRRWGNSFFIFLVNHLFGSRYTDLCYGYRSMTRESFDALGLRSEGFSIETEICIKAAKLGLRTIEVPSFEKKRLYGKAKLKMVRDGLTILGCIARQYMIRKRPGLPGRQEVPGGAK